MYLYGALTDVGFLDGGEGGFGGRPLFFSYMSKRKYSGNKVLNAGLNPSEIQGSPAKLGENAKCWGF